MANPAEIIPGPVKIHDGAVNVKKSVPAGDQKKTQMPRNDDGVMRGGFK